MHLPALALLLFACAHAASPAVMPATAGVEAMPERAQLLAVLGLEPDAGPSQVQSKVLEASLQAQGTAARIDDERAALQEAIDVLQARHDRRSTLLNVSAAIFAGGSAIGTALTLSQKTDTAGIWVTTVASAVGAVLSGTAALSTEVGRPPVRVVQPMLAPVLGRAPPVAYPPLVWRWLQSGPRQRLLSHWDLSDPELVAQLSNPIAPEQRIELGELQQRNQMLFEVRVAVMQLDRTLGSLFEPPH